MTDQTLNAAPKPVAPVLKPASPNSPGAVKKPPPYYIVIPKKPTPGLVKPGLKPGPVKPGSPVKPLPKGKGKGNLNPTAIN